MKNEPASLRPAAPGIVDDLLKAFMVHQPSLPMPLWNQGGQRIGPGKKSMMTSRCYQDRSRYTPQSARMAAYQPPVDDAGYVIGFGTTHRERKRRQWIKRMAAAKPA